MYYYDPKERKPKELLPGVRMRSFWGERVLIALLELDPGASVPRHTHPHEQLGIVLEGELDLGVGNQSRKLKPGEVYVIPSNVEHWVNTVQVPTRAMDIFSPVREEYKY